MSRVNRQTVLISISVVLVVLSLTIALPFVTCQNLVGGLTGTVADPSGAVVSGVQVKILSPNTGFQRVTVTRHDGTFQIADLPIGTYQVTLSPSRQPRRDPARLGEAGVEAFTIMPIAGHSSITVSQRYLHPTPAAVERLQPFMKSGPNRAKSVFPPGKISRRECFGSVHRPVRRNSS